MDGTCGKTQCSVEPDPIGSVMQTDSNLLTLGSSNFNIIHNYNKGVQSVSRPPSLVYGQNAP
eukprot:7501188-Pyramimonas_sp.AAC.1